MDRRTLLEPPPRIDESMARAWRGAAPKLAATGWLDELSAKSLEVACILFIFYVRVCESKQAELNRSPPWARDDVRESKSFSAMISPEIEWRLSSLFC